MPASTRGSYAVRSSRPLRTGGLLVALIVATVSCGKKGPPLAPFSRVPALITAVTPQRIGDDVYLTFTVPSANADGQKPATIGTVEVYAVTSAAPPANEMQREVATRVAEVPVRPILPEPPVPANGSAPPPVPLPPGVDQGAVRSLCEAGAFDSMVTDHPPNERRRVAL